jgi:hypothetical protein
VFHHGCEPQHQEEAGGGRHRAGAEGHHVRAYHLIELQKVCEAILGTFLDIWSLFSEKIMTDFVWKICKNLSLFLPDVVSFLAACAGNLLNCPFFDQNLWLSRFPVGLSKAN